MPVRAEAIRERLAKLDEVVERLVELAPLPLEAFLGDYRNLWLAERGLELGAQALLDVGNHILAARFSASAREYEEIVRALGQHGVISVELAQRLRGIGGFRSLLVHGDLELDPARVHQVLQVSVADFSDFAAELEAWLDSPAAKG